jgi:ABC-type multidrug transport system fused ATPase/permease subunit
MDRLLWFRDGEPQQIGRFSDEDFRLVIQELQRGEVIPKTDLAPNRFYTNEFIEKINDFDKIGRNRHRKGLQMTATSKSPPKLLLVEGGREAGLQGRLVAEEVSLSYQTDRGEIPALKNLTFGIKEGEFVSILGPSDAASRRS